MAIWDSLIGGINQAVGNDPNDGTNALMRFGQALQGGQQQQQNTPSAIREWQIYSAMTPAQKQEYLRMKRAEQWLNTGGSFTNPAMGTEIPKTLPPQELPDVKREQAKQAAVGASEGQQEAQKIKTTEALPSLTNTLKKLDELGEKATSTWAGKARDIAVQQLSGESTPQSDALVEYMNTGRNQLYPILRATLGAQFTAEEGERLLGTMVKEGASATQRRAILTAYIRGKLMEVDPTVQDARISDSGVEIKKDGKWGATGGLNSPQGGAVPLSTDSPGMEEMPPAAEHKGRVITETSTGKRFKSNGKTWEPF